MKPSRIFLYFLFALWNIYFILGILQNYTHYSILDWIVLAFIYFIPFVIYYISKNRKEKKQNPDSSSTRSDYLSNHATIKHSTEISPEIKDEANVLYNDLLLQTNSSEYASRVSSDYAKYMDFLQNTPLSHQYLGMKLHMSSLDEIVELNHDEQVFFKCFHDLLLANKLSPDKIELSKLSSGCFNVNYIGLCYVGKINLQEPPSTYAVTKPGNIRATRVFSSENEARDFLSSKPGYVIETRRDPRYTYMQCQKDLYCEKEYSNLTLQEYIDKIPLWIKYIKHSKRADTLWFIK